MFNETEFGFEFKTQTHVVFYGKKNCTIEVLQQIYPHFEFRQTRQTHSDILIKSTAGSDLVEADAHWTTEKNVALIIKTADCLPIFIYDEITNTAVAIHAGWRGIQNQITLKSLNKLPLIKNFQIYIGPHIQKSSFACDEDVKNLLCPSNCDVETKNGKYYVNLKNILHLQISSHEFKKNELDIDTVTNSNFNSYRRDKENSGRNLSFIAKLI